MSNLSKEIGEKIKAARTLKKYSQQTLAELTGTDQAYISRIEAGAFDIQLSSLERVSGALGKVLKINLHSKK